jgi:hypothetical protein
VKKKSGNRKCTKRDSLRFARYFFWVSWTWVLLFAVGELLEAERNEDYGPKIIFCTVTLLAIGCGGFALEGALKQVSAKSGRSKVDEREAVNSARRKKTEAETVDEPVSPQAKPSAEDAESKPGQQQKRRRSKQPSQ